MLCGFTKLHLSVSEQRAVSVAVLLRDIARWDPDAAAVDLRGRTVRGAYVVDAGDWVMSVGDCSGAVAAVGLQARCVEQQ